MQSCHPLVGVARWINARELYIDVDLLGATDPAPSGGEWTRLDRMPDRVPELIALLLERSCAGYTTSAAAFLASDAARQVLAFACVAAYLTGRAPDLAPQRTWVRHDPETGRLDRLALRQGAVAVVDGDPMARRPGAVCVSDEDALDAWFMGAAVAALEPVIDAVRAHTRYGTRAQWSMVADAPHAALIGASYEIGADQRTAWERARRMVEWINADRARVTPKQRPFPLVLAGQPEHRPERMFMVRGGCCFYYRFGGAKCAICPLSSDERRESVLREHFEPTTAPTTS
ncbi:hypothetical protein GCM10009799_29680 [Nocardiopsis rhodophaea]|uniref:Aerobactin siderophore biosynthesis IucA/IucC-like C-terminal domain-containing protein n=1 Tax=Nocardiopsis rhodophaea TaxID=280238 RepID=A0ABP5ELQ4_9ACTN